MLLVLEVRMLVALELLLLLLLQQLQLLRSVPMLKSFQSSTGAIAIRLNFIVHLVLLLEQ
jgi:hypothetical protein